MYLTILNQGSIASILTQLLKFQPVWGNAENCDEKNQRIISHREKLLVQVPSGVGYCQQKYYDTRL